MKKVILYKNKECIAIKSLYIVDSTYTFFVQVETKRIIYLKERNNNGKITYVSLDKLICLFDSYQKPYIFNIKVMLDSFISTLNYKIRKDIITNSEDLLDLINQFEDLINDPYIRIKTNPNETNIFSADAIKEVTRVIKKLEVRDKKISLYHLLHTSEETEQDIFTSQNWLDDSVIDNKKLLYESIEKSNKAHKKSPIDFLFNNKVLNIYMIIVVICAVGFAGCLEFLLAVRDDYKNVEQQIEELEKEDLTDPEQVEEIILPDDNGGSVSVIIADENKQSVKPKDFTKLKNKNSDTVGWLKVFDYGSNSKTKTLVDKVVVQSNADKDASTRDGRDYYLSHSFDNTESDLGWIYASRASDLNKFSKKNTVIYGHANKKMFGPLLTAYNESYWKKDKRNHVIKLETPNYVTYWKVISVYKTSKTELSKANAPSKMYFEKGEFIKWANKMVKKSVYNFNYQSSLNEKSQFLTLITCNRYDESNRVVVQAILYCKDKPGGTCSKK
jgi:hypothetical protein